MSDWGSAGVPPAAQARIERARRSGVRSSLLSVQGQAGIDSVGFEAVGEVMGCIVEHIGWQGYGGCGWYPGSGAGFGGYSAYNQGYRPGYGVSGGVRGANYVDLGASTVTSGSSRNSWSGFAPLVDALYRGWDTAMLRMITEAKELGADGIVGVALTQKHLGEGNREFLALGTGVRAVRGMHLARPFSTALAGQDVAKLIHRGWAPGSIVVAVSIGIRHDDYYTRQAVQQWAGNVEVPGYTELVQDTRVDARRELARRCAQTGADGAILTEPIRLEIHELEAGEGHRDHVGMATIVSTSVVAWRDQHARGAAHPGAGAGAGTVVEGLGGMQMVLPLGGRTAR
jgi:uncharacterized protein YbjQ (UPF0145 family)